MSRTLIASCNEEVPFIIATEYFDLVNLDILFSNLIVSELEVETFVDNKFFFT